MWQFEDSSRNYSKNSAQHYILLCLLLNFVIISITILKSSNYNEKYTKSVICDRFAEYET